MHSHFHAQPPTTVEVTLKLSWGCDNFILNFSLLGYVVTKKMKTGLKRKMTSKIKTIIQLKTTPQKVDNTQRLHYSVFSIFLMKKFQFGNFENPGGFSIFQKCLN